MTEQPDDDKKARKSKLVRDILLGGAIPGSIFVTFAAIYLLWPLDNIREQVGYRGVGMVQFTPADEAEALRAKNQVPENLAGPPIPPEPGEERMADIDFYENVKVLGHLTEANFTRLMAAMTEWVAPEQGCVYCHIETEDGGINFASEDNYTKHVARRMIQMTWNTNENWQSHVGMTGATCYTCHRGMPVPEYHFYEEPLPEAVAQMGMNTLVQNRADETVGYSSLPGDPLTAFLLETREIRVGDDFPRVPGNPAEGHPSIQDTEWTYGLMFHFSSSLGVNCTYCHNSRAWNQWDQSPPTRVKAWYAIRMLRDLNQNYMHNLDVYPDNRLGPLGDAPKGNCTTCHQGIAKPLYGVSMLDDWPELRTSGEPDYGVDDSQASAAPATEHADAGAAAAE